ncbi:MAG: hypothetical protein A2Y17_00870 [Clostridiales bacterium GWF2_38_85]|nr:MAG: hypothetical protein A2Y17_00870 [Clostridiales bacterium GWF2_38_85]HBL84555.1 RNA polymerase subunit sigma-70 [Clostridiales bacterium]
MYDATKNVSLLELARTGDNNALDELCRNNMGLVKSLAISFRDRGVEIEDLIQIGTIGLIKAIRGYDPSYGTVFSTYAVPLIIGEIKKYLRDDGIIKIGRNIKRNARIIASERDKYFSETGLEPTINVLSERCGLTEDDIITALDAANPLLSLDASYGDSPLDNTVGHDNISEMVEIMSVKQLVDALPEFEKKIIILRYYKNLTQTQTAKILGVSQVKISREEKKIIDRMRGLIIGNC